MLIYLWRICCRSEEILLDVERCECPTSPLLVTTDTATRSNMATFNARHRDIWFFGSMSRQDAETILNYRPIGEFIVRESNRTVGDYVLSVKEEHRICHYFINKITKTEITFDFGPDIIFPNGEHNSACYPSVLENTSYKIGSKTFPNLPSLLEYYCCHWLGTAYLVRPVPKRGGQAIREEKHQQQQHQKGASKNVKKWSLFETDKTPLVTSKPVEKNAEFAKEKTFVPKDNDLIHQRGEKEVFFDRENQFRTLMRNVDKGSFYNNEKPFHPQSVENRFYMDQDTPSPRVSRTHSRNLDRGTSFDPKQATFPRRAERQPYDQETLRGQSRNLDKRPLFDPEKVNFSRREVRELSPDQERPFLPKRVEKGFYINQENIKDLSRNELEDYSYDEVNDHQHGQKLSIDREPKAYSRNSEEGYSDDNEIAIVPRHHRVERDLDQSEHRNVEKGSFSQRENHKEHSINNVDENYVYDEVCNHDDHTERKLSFDQNKRRIDPENPFIPHKRDDEFFVEKVIAVYNFPGRDPDDLPFKKQEILLVVSKDEELWWTAKNSKGQSGTIPVNYVRPYK